MMNHLSDILVETEKCKDKDVKERKLEFLSRNEDAYGYKTSSKGYIDSWRSIEYPSLISTVGVISDQKKLEQSRVSILLERYCTNILQRIFNGEQSSNSVSITREEREVYLDYAGAALPTKSQLESIYMDTLQNHKNQILGNPHSGDNGPSSSRTWRQMELSKKEVMDHFGCDDLSNNKCVGGGYDILFTSGTTDALRILAETFPFSSGSNFVYTHNSHTSVVGMRNVALEKGASFTCFHLDDLLRKNQLNILDSNDFSFFEDMVADSTVTDDFKYTGGEEEEEEKKHDGETHIEQSNENLQLYYRKSIRHHLLVIPAECNFGGTRPKINLLLKKIESYNRSQQQQKFDEISQSSISPQVIHQWHCNIDIAKFASTSKINLCELNPDFACVSFYKIFGHPTGLGALFCKRSSIHLLTTPSTSYDTTQRKEQKERNYFGGGSVDVVLPQSDVMIPKNSKILTTSNNTNTSSLPISWSTSSLQSLSHGTCHFQGIVSLQYGFHEIKSIGGMDAISKHTTCLAKEFVMRLQKLHHNSSSGKAPLAVIYSPWHNNDYYDNNSMPNSYYNDPGPTVSFNVKRHDNSYVGCNEVAKMASLNEPKIQFRTGCFCNPGACHEALNLSEEQVLENYFVGGHVCGDHKDILQNKPTGCVRVSFGKDSTWEDLDAFISFLAKYFLKTTKEETIETLHVKNSSQLYINPSSSTQQKHDSTQSPTPQTISPKLSEMYIYPIKSCAAQRVQTWKINKATGRLLYDREFALVNASTGAALRLHSYPQMAYLQPTIDLTRNIMTVVVKKEMKAHGNIIIDCGNDDLVIDLTTFGNGDDESIGTKNTTNSTILARGNEYTIPISVCGNECGGEVVWEGKSRNPQCQSPSQWFSSFLGIKCHFVRYTNPNKKKNDSSPQQNHPQFTTPVTATSVSPPIRDTTIAFANDAPSLLISQESVNTLNTIMKSLNSSSKHPVKDISTRYFRPNFVVSGGGDKRLKSQESYRQDLPENTEDCWKKVLITSNNNDESSSSCPRTTTKVELDVVGKCARCQMVDIDPINGMKNEHSALRALAEYRRNRGHIMFGIFLSGHKSNKEKLQKERLEKETLEKERFEKSISSPTFGLRPGGFRPGGGGLRPQGPSPASGLRPGGAGLRPGGSRNIMQSPAKDTYSSVESGEQRVYSKSELLKFRDIPFCCTRPSDLIHRRITLSQSNRGNNDGRRQPRSQWARRGSGNEHTNKQSSRSVKTDHINEDYCWIQVGDTFNPIF